MIMKPSNHFTIPDTSSFDRATFLIGNPIAHSSSPALHRAIYTSKGKNWAQLLCESDDLASFVDYIKHEPKCMGSGVTMPHKVAIMPFLDELTPEGAAIGAVNTIVVKKGSDGQKKYIGTNTDCIGIRDAFLNNVQGTAYRGTPGLVIGGGGTCRAAVYSLQKFLGCSPVYIINRDQAEVEAVIEECEKRGAADNLIYVSSVEQAKSLAAPGLIVSAVPDFTPVTANEEAVRDILGHFLRKGATGAILEMCYHPSPDTQISRLAIASNWQVIGGLEAMIGQGLAQASMWTGIETDEEVRQIARTTIQKRLDEQRTGIVHAVHAPSATV